MKTDLSKYDNSGYNPGSKLKRVLWFWVQAICFHSKLIPFSGFLIVLLRLFGAKIGKRVVIKPGVNIKYPWNLEIGSYTWLGEGAWIDNLAKVQIGSHVCISQGAMLECGNHDFSKQTFDLKVEEILIEDGAWIGAQSFVPPGTKCESHCVLTAMSRAPKFMKAYSIYDGVPAIEIKKREIT